MHVLHELDHAEAGECLEGFCRNKRGCIIVHGMDVYGGLAVSYYGAGNVSDVGRHGPRFRYSAVSWPRHQQCSRYWLSDGDGGRMTRSCTSGIAKSAAGNAVGGGIS